MKRMHADSVADGGIKTVGLQVSVAGQLQSGRTARQTVQRNVQVPRQRRALRRVPER